MRKSLSQSWIPVKESRTVARVEMEGFSARVLVMLVRFAERLLKSITLPSTRREVAGN